ncbi:MAG: AsmA family protein [Pedosphaera sp.]|nr:AsmA family protein [Pedosphaera sp.]
MKKILIRIAIVLVVLVVLAVLAVALFLDGAIKKAVESVGPQIAKVEVKLDSVNLSLLSGSGKIKGLVLGNPEGFKSPHAISVGLTAVSVSPGSLLSDKVVVKSIRIEAPEIVYEIDSHGSANLKRIQANASSGSLPATNTPAATAKASKKLQVDDFVITGGKVTLATSLLGGKSFTAPLPDIHFSNLGTGPEGITAGELTKRILSEITQESLKVAEKMAGEAAKGAVDAASKAATETLGKGTKVFGDLLNKNKK